MRHLPTRCTRSPTFGLATERGSMCVHSARFGGATRQHVCILRTLWCYAAAGVYTAHALVLRGSMCIHCAPWCYAAACVYTAHALVLRGSMRVHCARVCTLRTFWCYAAAISAQMILGLFYCCYCEIFIQLPPYIMCVIALLLCNCYFRWASPPATGGAALASVSGNMKPASLYE